MNKQELKELLRKFYEADSTVTDFESFYDTWIQENNSFLSNVEKVVKTCDACPSQWEITLEDGRMVYVRFRWGNFSAYISKEPTTDISEAVLGDTLLYCENISDGLDGYLDDEQMIEILSEKLNFSIKGN
jgi:hypothetical protein